MVSVYEMQAGSRSLAETGEIREGVWINLENPSDKELEEINAKTGIPEDMLKAALDEEERAHIDIDDGCTLIIVDIPIISESDDAGDWYQYSTLPMGIVYNDGYFVTVCLRETAVLSDFIRGRVRGFDVNKKTRFIYQILYVNATKYLHFLKQIDKTSNRVQTKLHKAMKNKELIQLLDLEKALVYFSTSLNSNQIVIERLKALSTLKHYDDDNDIIDDVIIENKQAIEMATIYRDIMSGTMDAFASVISNNQNIVMKLLAAMTICLTIPSVISGLWGMNVPVPLQDYSWAFWVIVGIVAAILIPVIIVMVRKKMF